MLVCGACALERYRFLVVSSPGPLSAFQCFTLKNEGGLMSRDFDRHVT